MQENIDSVALSAADIDDRLDNGGTGVIALAKDDRPYAVPVSYGYDGDTFYLRLGFAPESEKRAFVAGRPTVKLVVYDEADEGWWSVVVTGTLDEVTEAALDSRVSTAIRQIDIPFVTIQEEAPRDIDFRLYRLDAESVTGRQER